MLCAGVTTYAALKRSGAQSGQWVVIVGAGGGLGHIATQIASRGMAMRVIGVDHGSKETLVKECGAEAFVDFTKFDDSSITQEVKRISGGLGASAVIVCTASNRAYAQAMGFLRFRGALVCVGLPEGEAMPISTAYPGDLIDLQAQIIGSAVGNQREALEVLDLAARGLVRTHFRIEKMENLTGVFEEMSQGKMQGRVVLDLS